MAYIAKFFVNNANHYNSLAGNDLAEKFDSLIDDTDFLGVKPGNPLCTLYSTQAAAQACVARELADSRITFIDEAEVVTLESEGLDQDDFYDVQTVIAIRASIQINATVLLGEDSAFQADGVGSNPIGRSKFAQVSLSATNGAKGNWK